MRPANISEPALQLATAERYAQIEAWVGRKCRMQSATEGANLLPRITQAMPAGPRTCRVFT